jgi:hypothetical protein
VIASAIVWRNWSNVLPVLWRCNAVVADLALQYHCHCLSSNDTNQNGMSRLRVIVLSGTSLLPTNIKGSPYLGVLRLVNKYCTVIQGGLPQVKHTFELLVGFHLLSHFLDKIVH